jgi:hypothetical protein
MRRNALTIGLLALALAFPGCDDDDDDTEAFTAGLSGANEVPARTTSASGMATFSFTGETVTYTLEVENIQNVTMAHIHSGAAGVNGPIRVFLFRGATPTSVGTRATLSSGSFTEADLTGVTFGGLLEEMRAGTAYVNVHTTQFPGGEIRGQVALR